MFAEAEAEEARRRDARLAILIAPLVARRVPARIIEAVPSLHAARIRFADGTSVLVRGAHPWRRRRPGQLGARPPGGAGPLLADEQRDGAGLQRERPAVPVRPPAHRPRPAGLTVTSVTNPLQLGIVGLGRMGRFHAAAIVGVEEVEVVALAEPSPEALAQASAIVPGAATYPVIGDALAHPGLEAVLVAAPTSLHPPIVEAALSAGVHVLCEKPLALDLDDARRLAALAHDRGRVLQVGFWRRFAPPWRTAKERIDAGEIGTPVYVRLAQWDGDPPPASFCDPAVSGGLAIDCGVHEYDLAEWLTGRRITRVSAWALPLVEPSVGEAGDLDNLLAVLELDDGAVATVDLTRNARYGDDVRTEVLGSQGALLVDLLPTSRTRLGDASGVRELPESAVEDAMAAGVAAQVRAFAAAVRGEAVEVPDAAASIRSSEVGQAVMAAARSHRPVDV